MAVIDTGSQRNVVTKSFISKLKNSHKAYLMAAGGHRVPVLGSAYLELNLSSFSTTCEALVIETLPFPLLLGLEFLEQHSATICLKSRTIDLVHRFMKYTVPIELEVPKANAVNLIRDPCSAISLSKTELYKSYKAEALRNIEYLFQENCMAKHDKAMSCHVESVKNTCIQIMEENNISHSQKDTSKDTCSLAASPRENIPDEQINLNSEALIHGISSVKIEERCEDMFTAPISYSLAHFGLNIEITKRFKTLYPNLEMYTNGLPIGGIATIQDKGRAIYSVVTKKSDWDFTTLDNLQLALKNLRNYVATNQITKLAIPKIEYDTSGLEWKLSKCLIENIFKDVCIDIMVCKQPDYEKTYTELSPLVHTDELNTQRLTQTDTLRKVHLCEDILIKSGEITTTPIGYDIDQRDLHTYFFFENENFTVPNKLLVNKPPNLTEEEPCITITNKGSYPARLYKGQTIGFVETIKEMEPQHSSIILYLEKDDKDVVTLEDHDLAHVDDSKFKKKIELLLQEFSDVFSKSIRKMGVTNLVEHKIDVGDAQPIKCRPYRVSQKEREIIDEQIKDMLQNDIIRPCHSPWSSPIVLVKKKDGSVRFCVNYKKLNNVTKKSNYPIPNIDDIMTYFGGAKYFSCLDMFSGYFQVKVEENSKQYTAFVAQGHGSYEFNVLSFGLCNGPSTFQALADEVFQGMKWKDVVIYLDDILVFSKTKDEHLQKLRRVFERLRQAGLTLKPSKCTYARTEVNVLGHTVSEAGISPDEEKLIAIKAFPVPRNVKSVQSFIGLCNYYRKFINNFSLIARPLHEATKKDTGFIWGPPQQQAFENLKQKLLTAPVLSHFNPDKECELRVDASTIGIGAILLQEDNDKKLHPVAYISRSLTKAEKNYGITELEGLAVIWALGYLRHLIYGRPVKIVTDHHALCWIRSLKDPTGRLARWSLKLSEYDYTIVHKSGASHKDADCLSRNPVLSAEDKPTIDIDEIPTFILQAKDIAQEQNSDKELANLREAILNPDGKTLSIGLARRAKNFRITDGVIYKVNPSPDGLQNLLVIPKHLIKEVLFSNHCEPLSGHLGIAKTLHKIRNRYYWTGLQKDVEKFVKGCVDCQARKGQENRKPVGFLQPIPVGTPFQRVGIDILGPFRRSKGGKTVIIVATDYATRWAETKALVSGKAEPVARFILENIIARHGAPRYLLSDRGQTFRSELVRELTKSMGTVNQYTTAYHPSCNGLTERLNKTLADMLSMYTNTNQTDWDVILPLVTFAYNTARQETTKFSPFMLVYGREPILPTEANLMETNIATDSFKLREMALAVRCEAVKNIFLKQDIDKQRYDNKHRHLEFKEGDKVKVFTPIRKVGKSEKLLLRWFGPYFINKKIGEVNYEVRKGPSKAAKTDTIHISRILPYNDPWSPEVVPIEDDT